MADLSRQIKKLTHRLIYLREEREDVSNAVESAKWEINMSIFELFSRAGKKIPQAQPNSVSVKNETTGDENQADQESADKSSNPDVKRLFRQIALRCHPDKLDVNDPALGEKTQQYTRAASAAKSGDISELIEIASLLDISLDIEDDSSLEDMNKRANDMDSEIAHMKATIFYKWSSSSTSKDNQKTILHQITAQMGYAPSDEELDWVVNWITARTEGTGSSYGSRPVKPEKQKAGKKPPKISKRRPV